MSAPVHASDESSGESLVRRIGPLHVAFSSPDAAVRDRLVHLYASFPAADRTTLEGATVIEVSIEREADGLAWVASVDGATWGRSEHVGHVEEAVTRRINRLVLDAEDDRLHIHAGAVVRDEVAVLVIGTSGSGKSTLVARLVADGWAYLSDEQLGVLEGARLVPYPRPLTLRRGSWPLLPGVVPDGLDEAIERHEVSPDTLGAAYAGVPRTPTLIVSPDVSRRGCTVEVLSAAETVAAILADTLDLGRAGSHGFDRVIELATSAPMVRVTGMSLDATTDAIAAQAAQSSPAPSVVAVTEPQSGSLVSATARAWRFSDDTAVIYDSASGALAQLDAAGSAAWGVLATQPAGELPAEATSSPFASELEAAGLLDRASDR